MNDRTGVGMPRLGILALGVAAGLSCVDATRSQCACTEEYRVFTVTVLDDALQPVDTATVVRTNLRTGRVLEPGWLGLPTPGTFVVADDGLLNEFSSAGDVVRVTVSRGGVSVSADFLFAAPLPCRCHVERRAGPDTVIVSR